MDPDIRDLGTLLIISVLLISGVQWFLLRFTHWSIALAATGIIAFIISFLYVSLKHATPNGGSNGPGSDEFINPALILFVALLCGLFAVSYLTKTPFPKKVIVIIVALIVLFVIVRYIIEDVKNATFYQKIFSSNNIEVVNLSGEDSMVRDINIQNSSSGVAVNLDPDLKEQNWTFIPRDADKIVFRCYSDKSNGGGLFSQNFPFDYSLCKEKDGKRVGFLLLFRMKTTLPVKIVLEPENHFSLYIDNQFIRSYKLKDKDQSETENSQNKQQ
ncbi:MAG: hypothetical protein EOO44_09490 [Flavobacterium sp.]|nr:MAG: hypothetical protein EOO44_09490 [Flavobacterium sp.]